MKTKFDFDLIERNYALGWHYLVCHKAAKNPVGNKWNKVPRLSLEEIKKKLNAGYNLGLLGNSPIEGGYFLTCIDCDVKKEASEEDVDGLRVKLESLFPGWEKFPRVNSGGGCGWHLYCHSTEPLNGGYLVRSKHWSIAIQGGKCNIIQPGSVHPTTGGLYTVANSLENFPVIDAFGLEPEKEASNKEEPLLDFKFEPVNLHSSKLSKKTVMLITKGDENSKDRSTDLYVCIKDMLRLKTFTDNQICSVFLDRENSLGNVAYEHANTDSLSTAYKWLYKYNFKKAKEELDAAKDFTVVDKGDSEDWRLKLVKTAKGTGYKPCLMNAILIFENEFGVKLFHKNDFSLRRTYGVNTPWGGVKDRELNDEDITAMRRWVCENYHFELEESHVVSAITSISSRNHHHPVTEYLDSQKWDGIPRVDTWLKDFAGVEVPIEHEPYLRAISRKVLCAMVTRAYHPGTKFDYVLILEGPNQGEGKSRSIRALASPDWAGTVRFDMDHKDFVLALQGRWATEISELSGLGRKNTAFVKAIVSEESDRIRHPYGRFTETLPRQGIFIGTTNHFQYLEDETGNRRFWPVRVGSKINVDGIASIRNQLFAEAKIFYEKGEPLYLENPKVELMAREVQLLRGSEDSWEEKIKLSLQTTKDFNPDKFKLLNLFTHGPFVGIHDTEANLRRCCRALRKLGYLPKNAKGEKGHGSYWVKKEHY